MTGHLGKTTNHVNDFVDARIDKKLQDQWGDLDGEIVSFDKATQTATIQPLYKPIHDGKPIKMPQLQEVKINFPKIGGFVITSPVKSGDGVKLRPNMRDTTNFHEDDGGFDAASTRTSSLSDMEAYLDGGESLKTPIENFNGDNFEIRSADGRFAMEMSEDGKFKMRGSEGNWFDIMSDAIGKCKEGFNKLGTEPNLIHTADYTALGVALGELENKMKGMAL